MPRSRSYHQRRRKAWMERKAFRKINAGTHAIVESVLKSVFGETFTMNNEPHMDSIFEEKMYIPEYFWTPTDVEREFFEAQRQQKNSPQMKKMVPFFSIDNSYEHTIEDQVELNKKWSVLLQKANMDPDLLRFIQSEEVCSTVTWTLG
ncbi:hypothetical protein DMENIID0001_047330 [Sergentomyia squamirostris]